jgi:peptidoglycan/xylan/chitin deacetylase (PgdA/CDA1 family)
MSPYSQLLGVFPYRARTSERVVALTFDDGPNEPYTSQIADYLDAERVKATFFQVGRAVRRYPEVTLRLAAAGHVIGHHGHDHQFGRYLRPSTLSNDLLKADAVFADVGFLPALYRPPWLVRIPSLGPILRGRQMTVVSGEFCHPLEVFQPAPERIARRALGMIGPGSIVIFHDGFDGRDGNRANTVKAVKIVVEQLKDRGFRFTTVDQLLGIAAYRPGPDQKSAGRDQRSR